MIFVKTYNKYMQKIQYISDIHLELLNKFQMQKVINNIIEKVENIENTILILAGDIGNPFSPNYLELLIKVNNCYKRIYLITGNHEYYNNGHNVEETNNKVKYLLQEHNLNKVIFLNNSFDIYENYLFIGSTLWSEINDFTNQINDLNCIPNMTFSYYNKLHKEGRSYIESVLDSDLAKDNIKIIVITHHLPLYQLIHPKFLGESVKKYNQWFASKLDDLMLKYSYKDIGSNGNKEEKNKISAWFYGHSHIPNDDELYGIKFYCNSIGYKDENCGKKNYQRFIEL